MVTRPRGSQEAGQGRWDLSTALVTGIAAAVVAAVMGAVLHGGVLLTLLAAATTGVVVALLAGYRPLHEEDSDRAEAELHHPWAHRRPGDRAA